jgi:hypothetical protein
MEQLSPFLVGGPAFSGTTLLALLCNQPGMVCLDEPDFEDPAQAHRGVPVLRGLCPDATIPDLPGHALDWDEAFEFVRDCAAAVRPIALGIKTCDRRFVEYARRFRAHGLPVVAVVRDIRDALARPLPEWQTEERLNDGYRRVWRNLGLTTTWIRYEDLVQTPRETLAVVAEALGYRGTMQVTWDPATVPRAMIKNGRHEPLRSGAITTTRVGAGRASGRDFSPATIETARTMGYRA